MIDSRFQAFLRHELYALFAGNFPITDLTGRVTVDAEAIEVGRPEDDDVEARREGRTWGAPVSARVVVASPDGVERGLWDLGMVPAVAADGHFVIGGHEYFLGTRFRNGPAERYAENLRRLIPAWRKGVIERLALMTPAEVARNGNRIRYDGALLSRPNLEARLAFLKDLDRLKQRDDVRVYDAGERVASVSELGWFRDELGVVEFVDARIVIAPASDYDPDCLDGNTALVLAWREGEPFVVQELGGDVFVHTGSGWSPIADWFAEFIAGVAAEGPAWLIR